ncbi:MAG: hypothetical protein M3Z80_06140 [Apibacter sp.]|uniref:endonuclease/exonuclease/phosphatase family protein n=1 Tax=Apibacter sp. TaxID=2023709 RepID=UPI0025F81C24|nr:hypothetical protein [Apibacter sp.]MCT6869505.1 hypothetical protein [Apibacter sp.]
MNKKSCFNLSRGKMNIFSPAYLITREDSRKDYPYRFFSNDHYINGYSDHFPPLYRSD